MITLTPETLRTWPPQGWVFRTVLPNGEIWHAPGPLVNSFRQQVGNIITWRRHNAGIAAKLKLSTNWNEVANELIQFTVARLQKMPKAERYLLDDSAVQEEAKKKLSLWGHVSDAAAAAANAREIMSDWFGAGGKPVLHDLAEQRAEICVTCPQNSRKHWSLFFTKPIAQGFARVVEHKNQIQLSTSRDSELGACKACSCVLPLKVHVPLKHILANTPPADLQKLDPRCWILKRT